MATEKKDNIPHVNKTQYHPQKKNPSPHRPAAKHLPLTAGVHLGRKLLAAVLYSIHFLDQ